MSTCLSKIPKCNDQYLVGMTNGTLQKVKKYKHLTGTHGPRTFYTNRGFSYKTFKMIPFQDLSAEITCIRFSPFDPNIFVAGSYDSNLYFFHLTKNESLKVLASPAELVQNREDVEDGLTVTSIEWSLNFEYIIYCILSGDHLVVWNLMENRGEVTSLKNEFKSKIISTEIWRDSVSRNCLMAFGLQNGEMSIHCLENYVASQKMDSANVTSNNLKLVDILKKI